MSKRRRAPKILPDADQVFVARAPQWQGAVGRWLEIVAWPLLICVAVFLASWRPLRDPDFWFHLSFARQFWDTGSFPRVDPFAFTSGNGYWVSSGWLSSLVMEWLFRSVTDNGMENGTGVLALVVAAGSLAFCGVYVYGLRHGGGGVLVLLLLAGVVASALRFVPRPDVFSQPLLVGLLVLLLHLDRHLEKTTAFPKSAWLIPVLIMIWANVHAGFLMGLIILSLFGIDLLLRLRKARPGSESRRTLGRILIFVGAGLVVWMVNPYGPAILYLPLAISQIPDVGIIYEWKPIWTDDPSARMPVAVQCAFWFVVLLGLILLYLSFPWSRGPVQKSSEDSEPESVSPRGWWQIAVVIFLLLAALTQRRHLALAILGLLSILAAHASGIEGALRQFFAARVFAPLVGWGATVAILSSGMAGIMAGPPRSGRDCALLPCHLAEFFGYFPPPANLYNNYGLGGYLTYINGPKTKVFIDGRLDVYPHDVWRDYRAIDDGSMSIDEAVAKYDLRTFALESSNAFLDSRDLAFRLLEREDFRLVHFDDFYSGIVRVDDVTSTYVQKLGFRLLNPHNPERTLKAALDPTLREDIVKEAKRAVIQSNESANALALAALVSLGLAVQTGDPAPFEEAQELLTRARARRSDAPIVGYVAGVMERAVTMEAERQLRNIEAQRPAGSRR